jgi:uncharacterized protein YkwD
MVFVRPHSFLLIFLLLASAFGSDFESSIEQKMFAMVNRERANAGVSELKWSDKLKQSARKHTEKLAEHRMLSHQFSDEPNVQARMAATGFHFSASAENVASTSGRSIADAAEEMHQGLMSSPGHRANILNPKYTAVGIGVVRKGNSYYATQNFARATDDYSSNDAEQRMAEAINKLRTKQRLAAVSIVPSPGLRESLCREADRDSLSARNLAVDPGYHGISAATAFGVDDVPDSFEKFALDTNLKKMGIAACFRVTPKYPGGMYWFAFEY